MAATVQITFDAHDPGTLACFWAQALRYQLDDPPQGYDDWPAFLQAHGVPEDQWNHACAIHDPEGVGPRLFFQQVPEPKTAKNRCHLDIRVAVGLEGEPRMAALEMEGDRLVALGAQRVRRADPEDLMTSGHLVMTDPEGNEFCLD